MLVARPSLLDDSNSRVAAYESLLDLFTLLSLVLIFAAVIYAKRSATPGSEMMSTVVADVTQQGSAVSATLPANELLLVIHRQNGVDKLTVVGSAPTQPRHFDVTEETVDAAMNDTSSMFNGIEQINVALYGGTEGFNANIFVALSLWLATHGHNNYRVYHTGHSE